jgi:hypothetical protein
MKYLPPPSQLAPRATRVHFADCTPVVIRLKDGRRVPGKLKVVSMTGGLLTVPRPLDTGTHGKLLFLTAAGMVLGSAEMLSPLSWSLQPFRFVGLNPDAQNRLQTVIQGAIAQSRTNHGQIERSRSW